MHMLQQNWYNDGNRYFKWILDNITRVFITYDLLFIFFVLFKYVKFNASVIIFSIFYIIVYFLVCFVIIATQLLHNSLYSRIPAWQTNIGKVVIFQHKGAALPGQAVA